MKIWHILKKVLYLIVLCLVFSIIYPVVVYAQNNELPVLSAEIFLLIEDISDFYIPGEFGISNTKKESESEKEARLMEEAEFVFSGMLYGFEFKYVPGDRRRNVDELFDFNLIEIIRKEDPRLTFSLARKEDNKEIYLFRYYPDDHMKNWITYWSSSSFPVVGGRAESDVLEGFVGKKNAVEKAVKNAVRTYMKSRIQNKPEVIEGEFVFLSSPVIGYASGIYTASVKIKLNVENVSAYDIY